MTQPIAIGFTDGIIAIDELRQRVLAGHHHFAIMMAGGLAISRKTIRLGSKAGVGRVWVIDNEIDGTHQKLTTPQLKTESNIGEALAKRALLDMDGNDGIVNIAGRGWVEEGPWLAEVRAQQEAEQAKARENDGPLTYRLDAAPGAIRVGEDADWEPADPSLVLGICEIGPHTVASIDLAATTMLFVDGKTGEPANVPQTAATSIELTIEDIDDLIAALAAIREDAVTRRGFAERADGYWSNGEE